MKPNINSMTLESKTCHLAYKSNTSRFFPAPCGKVAAQSQNIASDASAVAKFSTRVESWVV